VKIRRVDWSFDEWIAGTAGMSLEEEGLYVRICNLIYSRGGKPLSIEHLKRCCAEHGNKINSLLAKLVSTEKIDRNGDEISQKRCRIELEKAAIRSRIASENISHRWHNNAVTDTGVLPHGNPNHQPSTIIKKESLPSVAGATAKGNGHDGSARARRIPPTWRPSAEDRGYAAERGHDERWVDTEFPRFIDHHRNKKPLLDFSAAWRNWVRTAEDFATRGSYGDRRPGGYRSEPGSFVAALRRLPDDPSVES
jgi:uncharacterized protein YdaU (DUF1376 family)